MFENLVWHFFQLPNPGHARVNTIAPPTRDNACMLSVPQVREYGLRPHKSNFLAYRT
jgi:hypothetical protein